VPFGVRKLKLNIEPIYLKKIERKKLQWRLWGKFKKKIKMIATKLQRK